MTKFPDWAPPCLVEYYNQKKSEASPLPSAKIELEIALALATHKDMETAWEELYKTYRGYSDPYHHMPNYLLSYVTYSFQYAQLKQRTRSECVKPYKKIAEEALSLAEKIKGVMAVDLPLMEFMTTEAISEIIDGMKPDMVTSGLCCLINDESDIDKKGGIYAAWESINTNNGEIETDFTKLYHNTDDYYLMTMAPQNPTLVY